jgi:polyisoprenoid-binding protein YceI
MSEEGMAMAKSILAGLMVGVLSLPVFASGSTWQIDPAHSSFQFKIRHLTVSNVKGEFDKSSGNVTLDDQDPTKLKVEVRIEAGSVNTHHAMRDEHLKGPDFFDVTKFPFITFVSKKVVLDGVNRLKITGDLTIKGVTKEVTVDVEGPTAEIKDPGGNLRRGATGTARINRKDFGMTWNKILDTGGLLVGEDVDLSIEVELVKK